jgi:hypothetical protein
MFGGLCNELISQGWTRPGARTQCWRTLGRRVCCGGGLGNGRRRNVTTTTRKKFTRHNPSRTAGTPRRHRIGYPARPPDRVRRRKAVRGCALRHAAKPGDDAHTFPGTIERTVSWPLNAAVRVPLVIQSTITDRLPRLHPTEAGREPGGSLTVPPDVPARLMQPAASGGFSGGWPRAGCELPGVFFENRHKEETHHLREAGSNAAIYIWPTR